MSVEDRVRQFVSDNFYVGDATALTDDASLMELGIMDSTGVLEVVSFLEHTFQINVDDDEIVPENLDSLAGIARFVATKQAEAAETRER